MLTVFGLMESMEKELKKVFAGMLFHNVSGGMEEIRIYQQDIPLQEIELRDNEEEAYKEEDVFPYCVIRAARGEVSQDPGKVITTLEFGLYEKGKRNDGELRILNLIERVCQRFTRDRMLDAWFMVSRESPIRWELTEENTYPYFLGGMEITWETPACVEEEDIYA